MSAKGCVHVHIKDGKIANAFSHLTDYPNSCVIHLSPDSLVTEEEFKKDHPNDVDELKAEPQGRIYDLRDKNYEIR